MSRYRLERMPHLAGLYAAALTRPKARTLATSRALPDSSVEVSGVTLDPARLAAYRRLCGFDESNQLPITYLFILMFPLQLYLLTRPEWPLRLPGLVHRGIQLERLADGLADPLSLHCSTGPATPTDLGTEFELVLETRAAGTPIWRARSRILARSGAGRGRRDRRPDDAAADPGTLDRAGRLDGSTRASRRYARVSGDWNPIHLGWAGARLFGYRRPIAHGMWTLACMLAQAGLDRGMAGDTFDAAFLAPFYLPGTADIHTDEQRFLLRNPASGRILLRGHRN